MKLLLVLLFAPLLSYSCEVHYEHWFLGGSLNHWEQLLNYNPPEGSVRFESDKGVIFDTPSKYSHLKGVEGYFVDYRIDINGHDKQMGRKLTSYGECKGYTVNTYWMLKNHPIDSEGRKSAVQYELVIWSGDKKRVVITNPTYINEHNPNKLVIKRDHINECETMRNVDRIEVRVYGPYDQKNQGTVHLQGVKIFRD